MKTHTTLGYNIVKNRQGMEMAADITLHHHERFDGSGYPAGLYGYKIPISAQITGIVDVYDALRSQRPYKRAWSHDDTIAYVRDHSGTHFCPELADAVIGLEKEFKALYTET
jgi:putative two-component system response regulator